MTGTMASVFITLSLLLLLEAGPGMAEDAKPPTPPPSASTALPCVEVQVGNDRAGLLDCLNQQFRRTADGRLIKPVLPYGTASPPNEIGLFNETAERERLGSNFGRSAQPQRPTPPTH